MYILNPQHPIAKKLLAAELRLRDLTEEEKRALRLFVLANGRTWKSKLRLWWMNPGVVTTEDDRLLYCLRNTHGTIWLSKLRFP